MLNDRLFMVTDNAHLIALDRVTGRLLWDVAIADSKRGELHSESTAWA